MSMSANHTYHEAEPSSPDDIVITGLSGRLPESNNIEEFKDQLFAGVDMVTADDRRWPRGLHGLPERGGKIKDLVHFDAQFFGVHTKQADVMDPQTRLLLEVTYEAIVDAGFNPAELRGSRTGVFVGVSSAESGEYWSQNAANVNIYVPTGCFRSMIANRVSFSFDLTGPSFAVDSACASSLFALEEAMRAMRDGRCDASVVAGCSLGLNPSTSLQFHRIHMLSTDGRCKAFDESANGYVRSEAVSAVLLQKASAARRVYATLVHAGTNTDGYKAEGITFPSAAMQRRLMERVYREAGVDPADVSFVEAHATGTKAGDPQEVQALAEVFCDNVRRTGPLLVGSVKSNIGHPEAAAGLCSIAKVLIAMERGEIPGNLHFKQPHPAIPALHDGRVHVVHKNRPWAGGLAAVNSFGFGGSNAHVILRSQPKCKQALSAGSWPFPRLVTVSGRTEEAVRHLLDQAARHRDDVELHALLADIHRLNVAGHAYRGYAVLPALQAECADGNADAHDVREVSMAGGTGRPVWWVFSGLGSQCPAMAKAMMALPPFASSVRACAAALAPHGVDLVDLVVNGDATAFDNNVLNAFVSIVAVEVALVDVLRALGVQPDGMLGHSVGELGCAYADGTLTAEQAVLAAYWRGHSILESNLPPGAMASVGLSWEEVEARVPTDVFPACHNAVDSVTVSGPPDSVARLCDALESEGVFVRRVASCGLAAHSKYVADAAPRLRRRLEALVPDPKPRSARWVSSSVPESDWGTPLARLSSAAYHVNNLVSPVRFAEALRHVPEDAIVLEVAPHCLLQPIIKRACGLGATVIGLMRRGHQDNLGGVLAAFGKAYIAGAQPQVGHLLPHVTYPVSRGTPMLSPMVRWDHSAEWAVADFSGTESRSGVVEVVDVDLSSEEGAQFAGHAIDGCAVFPATGFMALVWEMFAKQHKKCMEDVAVVMEDVHFHRTIAMHTNGPIKFLVNILEGSGAFEVCESGSVVATGRIYAAPENGVEDAFMDLAELDVLQIHKNGALPLNTADAYKELRLRGREDSGAFQGIESSDNCGRYGRLRWTGNWVSFMDTVVQFAYLSMATRDLHLLTHVQRVIVDPGRHRLAVEALGAEGGGIPVAHSGHLNVLQAGGVEMSGLQSTSTPRRQKIHDDPQLQEYVFVPYVRRTAPEAAKLDATRHGGLMAAVQIVLKNLGTFTVKIVELAADRTEDALLAPDLIRIIEKEPRMQTDVWVASTTADAVSPEVEKLGVKLLRADAAHGPLDPGASTHIVVASGMAGVDDAALWRHVADSLQPGGFVLLDETADSDGASLQRVPGLTVVTVLAAGERSIVLLRKPTAIDNPDAPTTVARVSSTDFAWVEPLKAVLAQSDADGRRVVLVSQGEEASGLVGLVNCLLVEPGGQNIRAVLIQDPAAPAFSPTLPLYADQLIRGLCTNVLRPGGVWGSFRHLPLQLDKDTATVQAEHAYLNALTRGDPSSLRWVEGPLALGAPPPSGAEVCSVYYAPLSFRDAVVVSGTPSADALPGHDDGEDCELGLEFSGRDSRGRRVMGLVASRALATTVLADPAALWKVPDDWTLEQAASVPLCYATAYYALVVLGRIRRGESVLVHCGAGGVGQAAIALALHAGCTVFATAGSDEKRAFLRTAFPALDDDHISSSRVTTFQRRVLRGTEGRGVDLVLSSLSGETLLLASARCLARRGRFVELGRADGPLAPPAPLGTALFLRNATFHGVRMDALLRPRSAAERAERDEVVRLVGHGVATGAVRPLPVTAFADHEAQQAFRFLACGKNIGKVVLQIREEERGPMPVAEPSCKTVLAVRRTYMHPDKTYVVAGGLGGFGLELSDWLVRRGARILVLLSRSGVRTGYQSLRVRRWREAGVHVLVSSEDCATDAGACRLLRQAVRLGPVGGIFNVAAVLRDAHFENLTEDDFTAVLAPKVVLGAALDRASRALCPGLDHFVLFSSESGSRGNAGQSNYGMANSAMERLCEARRADGLPGLAIQWGPIGDVGIIWDVVKGGNDSDVMGYRPQRVRSCLATLDTFLRLPQPVLTSMLVTAIESRGSGAKKTAGSALDAVASILGLKDVRAVAASQSLADLGMDSIMGAEVQQVLQRNYDTSLSAREIRNLTLSRLTALSKGQGSMT